MTLQKPGGEFAVLTNETRHGKRRGLGKGRVIAHGRPQANRLEHPRIGWCWCHRIPTKTLVKLPGTRVGFSVETHQANPLLANGTGNFVKFYACLLIV